MKEDKPFVSHASRYEENMEASPRTYARAGFMETAAGRYEPAVILFQSRYCRAVLTPDDAIRVSNELVDEAERSLSNG